MRLTWTIMMAVLLLTSAGTEGAEAKQEAAKSVFELSLDFGTVCRFGNASWRELLKPGETVDITSSSLGISAWGGLWGHKWSMAEAMSNGQEVLSPAGRTLKLMITVRGEAPYVKLPIGDMTIEYSPVSQPAAKVAPYRVDLSRAEPEFKNVTGIPLTRAVTTPHIRWGKPFTEGTIKVLFLLSHDMQREVLELDQRMDIQFDAPTLVKYGTRWAEASFYRGLLSPGGALRRLEKLVGENTYDAIVMGGVYWANLPEKARDRIKEMVEEGAGLVLCLDPREMGDLEKLAPLGGFVPSTRKKDAQMGLALIGEFKGGWLPAGDHFITTGVPIRFLPETNYYKYSRSRNVLLTANGDPILAIGRMGQGRVVQFSYSSPDDWAGNCALTPSVDRSAVHYSYWEYYLSLVSKGILWAARREPVVMIRKISPAGEEFAALDGGKIALVLENTRSTGGMLPPDPVKVDVEITIRDEFHNEEKRLTRSATLQAGPSGAQTIDVPIPSDLKAGQHFGDVIIRSDGKVANWGTAYFTVRRKAGISRITTDKEIYRVADRARITAELTGSAEGMVARLGVYDTYGRLLGSYRSKVADTQAVFTHPLTDVRSHYMTLECELLKDEQVVDISKAELRIRYPHKWDDFEIIVWAFTGMQTVDYIIPYYYPVFRDFGATALLEDYRAAKNLLKEHVWNNFASAPIGIYGSTFDPSAVTKKYVETKDKTVLVRSPCLSEPARKQSNVRAAEGIAKMYDSWGAVGFCMADESSLTSPGVPRRTSRAGDVCFSPACMKDFRQWLRDKYGTLDDVNAEWGTAYEKWDDVLPATFQEMRTVEDGNYSSWADHREFMDDVWAGGYRRFYDGFRAHEPQARIGVSGAGPPSPYTGLDYWKLGKLFNYMNLYRWVSQGELWSSFFPDHKYTHWAGYGGLGEAKPRYGIWWSVANNHKGISYFKTPWFINPDLTLSEHARYIKKNLKDVREGIGRAVMEAEKLNDGIAILYSQPSLRAAWITGEGKPMAKASKYEYHEKTDHGPGVSWDEVRYIDTLDTYCMLLKGASLGYRFVSCEQVAGGELDKGNYKALILPMAMALPADTSEAIRAFVAGGGMVVADVLPGVMDGHCKTRKTSVLNDVFGAEMAGADWSRQPGKIEMSGAPWSRVDLGTYTVDRALGTGAAKATTAKALGTFTRAAETVPVGLANNYGKGKAVYLNFFLSNLNDTYTWRRDSELLARLLAGAGVTSRVRVERDGKSLLNYETAIFRNGPIEYLLVLRSMTVTTFDTDAKIDIVLPKEYFLYNVRQRAFTGLGNRIEAEILPGDAVFYALSPYEIQGIRIETDRDAYAGGQPVRCRLAVMADKAAGGADHVIRLEVYDPAGKLSVPYTTNIVAKAGRAEHVLPLALNDTLGRWTLKVRDVASGKTAEARILVQGPK